MKIILLRQTIVVIPLYNYFKGKVHLSPQAKMKTFGDKIKAIRLAQNRTQEDIAYDLDMTVSSYSKIERNVTDVNLSRILQIAKVFKMSVGEIFNYGEPKSKLEKELEKLRKSNLEKDKLLAKKDSELLDIQRKLIKALSSSKK